jgi:methionyl-tRNA synthetase
LTVYLKPVVPNVAAGVEKFFNIAPMSWGDVNKSLTSKQAINPYQHLMTRIDPAIIEKLIEANQQ